MFHYRFKAEFVTLVSLKVPSGWYAMAWLESCGISWYATSWYAGLLLYPAAQLPSADPPRSEHSVVV